MEIVEKIADTQGLSIPFERSIEDLSISFELSALWKGELRKDVAIRTGLWDALCGYHFELGEQYLVYAYSSGDGALHAGICSRTNVLAAAAEDMEQLGEPISRWHLNADTEDFLALPEILGRWEIESDMEHDASISRSPALWRLLEFRPDGACVVNMVLPNLLAIAEFPYAKERTLLFGDEKWQKVVLSPIQSAYVDRGNGWGAETFQVWPEFFFALSGDGKLIAIVENLGILSANSFRRTDRPIYSVTPDGRVTSVAPMTWGGVKKETRQPSPSHQVRDGGVSLSEAPKPTLWNRIDRFSGDRAWGVEPPSSNPAAQDAPGRGRRPRRHAGDRGTSIHALFSK